MKQFSITLDYDGASTVYVNYNDGSDTEQYVVSDEADIQSAAAEAIKTALSPEDD